MKSKFLITCCMMLTICVTVACVGCASPNNTENLIRQASTYEITAQLDYEAKTLTADMNLKYHNTSASDFGELKFHLYPNAFRSDATTYRATSESQKAKTYPNGFSEGSITINSVAVNGKTADFSIGGEDKNLLVVPLNSTLKSGDWTDFNVKFMLTIPNCNHRFGYGENTLNLGNWYPIACVFENGEFVTDGYSPNGDPFFSEVANYRLSISYHEKLTLASAGNLVSEDTQNGIKTSTYSANIIRDFALIFSQKFQSLSQKVGETTVSYYFFDDKNAESNLTTAVDALTTFNAMFGDYPYENLRVVKADFCQGGMEYPTIVYVSSGLDVDSEYKEAIIHEIAHQWWYGIVGNNECEYAWLDEGLAEYSTALFYDKNPAYNRTSKQVFGETLSSYLLFCDVYRDVYDELDTSMNRNIHKFNTETEYVYLTYVKGALMFDSINDLIGESKMQRSLRYFYAQNQYKIATPSDLIAAFETTTHKKLAGYIMSWLDGSVVLESLA